MSILGNILLQLSVLFCNWQYYIQGNASLAKKKKEKQNHKNIKTFLVSFVQPAGLKSLLPAIMSLIRPHLSFPKVNTTVPSHYLEWLLRSLRFFTSVSWGYFPAQIYFANLKSVVFFLPSIFDLPSKLNIFFLYFSLLYPILFCFFLFLLSLCLSFFLYPLLYLSHSVSLFTCLLFPLLPLSYLSPDWLCLFSICLFLFLSSTFFCGCLQLSFFGWLLPNFCHSPFFSRVFAIIFI